MPNKNTKEQNVASLEGIVIPGLDIAGLKGYRDQQVGFAPYWSADEEAPDFTDMSLPLEKFLPEAIMAGRAFLAKPVDFDGKDPDFHRYIMQAGHQIKCFRGPGSRKEVVMVEKYDFFSISEYAGLPIAAMMGLPIIVVAKNKLLVPGNDKVKGEHHIWQWRVITSEEVSRRLDKRREEAMRSAQRGAMGGYKVPAALPQGNVVTPNGHGEVPAPMAAQDRGDAYEEDIPF
jgi:hypothetical protein